MSYGVKMHVWGEYALFSRAEFSTERCSYDVMTPSAARGILESVYYHPGLSYKIDKIYVRKPIRFTNIRRNEVKSKISARNVRTAVTSGKEVPVLYTKNDIVQRSAMVLQDVDYIISAHFDMTDRANETDNPGKFKDIFMRRLRKGACYSQPYFGVREFPANFEPWEGEEIITAYPDSDRDLGLMLYDMDYQNAKGERWAAKIEPMFFHAVLEKGVLDVTNVTII